MKAAAMIKCAQIFHFMELMIYASYQSLASRRRRKIASQARKFPSSLCNAYLHVQVRANCAFCAPSDEIISMIKDRRGRRISFY